MSKHWTQWGTIVQQQASRQKRNLKVDLGKCVQMYRAPFLYLPGAPNSLNPPLHTCSCSEADPLPFLCWKTPKLVQMCSKPRDENKDGLNYIIFHEQMMKTFP